MSIRHKNLYRAACEILGEYAWDRGVLGIPKLAAKCLLLAARYPAHRRWLRVIGGETTRRILVVDSRIAFRHSSKYLCSGLPWRDRMALLTVHYAFLNRHLDASFFDEIIAPRGYRLWSAPSHDGDVAVVLCGPPHHREGDLGLNLLLDGVTLFRIAFSIIPGDFFAIPDASAPSREALYIGQVQGVPGQLDAIRHATRLCNGVAPPDLLMSALAGVARAWEVNRFLSAGKARHHSLRKLSASAHAFEYTAFWERYQARLDHDGHNMIDVPFPQKPILEIVNRHRKRTLLKRRYKAELTHAVATRMIARCSPMQGAHATQSSHRSGRPGIGARPGLRESMPAPDGPVAG